MSERFKIYSVNRGNRDKFDTPNIHMNDLSLPGLSTRSSIHKRPTNPKGSSKMDNLETYATMGYKINDDDKQKKKHNPEN